MKTYTMRTIYFVMTVLVILVACQSVPEKQVIVYISDFQFWTIHPDGTHIELIEPSFTNDVPQWSHLRWSPDGKQIAFTVVTEDDLSSIWVANSDGAEPHPVTKNFDSIDATWLNNDTLITHVVTEKKQSGVSNYANYILNLQDNTMKMYSQGPEDIVALSLGNRWLAWNKWEAKFIFYDVLGNRYSLFPQFRLNFHTIHISPSGREAVFCYDEIIATETQPDGLYYVDLEAKEATDPYFAYPIDNCQFTRWSPNGKYIALLDSQDGLYILDATSFTLVNMFDVGPLTTSSFVWSPDSKYLAIHKHYGEPGPGPKELARVNVTNGEILRLTDNDRVETLIDWVSIPEKR